MATQRDGKTEAKAWLRSELIPSGTNQNYWTGKAASTKQQLVLNAEAEKDARAVDGFGGLSDIEKAAAITAAKALVEMTSDEIMIVEHEGYVSGFYYDHTDLNKATITKGAGLTSTYMKKNFKQAFKSHLEYLKGTPAVAKVDAVTEVKNDEGVITTAGVTAVAAVAAKPGILTNWDSLPAEVQTQMISLNYRGDLKKSYSSVKALNEVNAETGEAAPNYAEAWKFLSNYDETDMYSIHASRGVKRRKRAAIDAVAAAGDIASSTVDEWIADKQAFYTYHTSDSRMQHSGSNGGYGSTEKERRWNLWEADKEDVKEFFKPADANVTNPWDSFTSKQKALILKKYRGTSVESKNGFKHLTNSIGKETLKLIKAAKFKDAGLESVNGWTNTPPKATALKTEMDTLVTDMEALIPSTVIGSLENIDNNSYAANNEDVYNMTKILNQNIWSSEQSAEGGVHQVSAEQNEHRELNPINRQEIQDYTGPSVALVDSFEKHYGNTGKDINEALYTHLNTHGVDLDMKAAIDAGDREAAIFYVKTNLDYINSEKTGISNAITDNINDVINGFNKDTGGTFNV